MEWGAEGGERSLYIYIYIYEVGCGERGWGWDEGGIGRGEIRGGKVVKRPRGSLHSDVIEVKR